MKKKQSVIFFTFLGVLLILAGCAGSPSVPEGTTTVTINDDEFKSILRFNHYKV
jgi:hypothetical protein